MKRLWRRSDGGIYVEALVAIAILAIALVPIIGSYGVTPAAQRQAGAYVAATNIARGRLETLHGLSGSDWDNLASLTEEVSVDGQRYTVVRTVKPARADGLRDVLITVQ